MPDDPEIRAAATLWEAVSALDAAARERVLEWALERSREESRRAESFPAGEQPTRVMP